MALQYIPSSYTPASGGYGTSGGSWVNPDAQTAGVNVAGQLALQQGHLPLDWAQLAAQQQQAGQQFQLGMHGIDTNAASGQAIAKTQADASKFGATSQLQGTLGAAESQKQAALGVASTNKESALGTAQLGLQGQEFGATAAKQAAMYGADASKAANMYGSDKQLQGVQAQVGLKQGIFNQVFPAFQGYLNGQGGQQGSSSSPTLLEPGGGGSLPYTQDQIQANVNQQRAQNDAAAGSQKLQTSRGLAAQGFGGNSPLYNSLTRQIDAQNYQGNQAAETTTRNNAAVANSSASIQNAGQHAQAVAAYNDALVARQRNQLNFGSQLLQALAGLA